MVANERFFKGIRIGTYDSKEKLAKALNKHIKTKDVVFFCVGTDRSTGDSFAPFIGTMLSDLGYKNVIGTIDYPVHALNITERMKEIPKDKTVIAIDACLGKINNIGKINLDSGALHAGKGVGKDLPLVGDYSLTGVVNISTELNDLNLKILQNTRLSTVLNMAITVVESIKLAFPLVEGNGDYKDSINKIYNI